MIVRPSKANVDYCRTSLENERKRIYKKKKKKEKKHLSMENPDLGNSYLLGDLGGRNTNFNFSIENFVEN